MPNSYPSASEPSDDRALIAVLVLYMCRIEDSLSYQTFKRASEAAGVHVPLIVYDNSPEPQAVGSWLSAEVTYFHNASNGGLVGAYNFALDRCRATGVPWLLLLDQDTSLPEPYLRAFFSVVRSASRECAAFVPRVRINGRLSSPKRFILTRPRLPMKATFTGQAREEIVAINSGMFVSVEHLRARGNYPSHYWLDAVDFWFCADTYACGKHLYVLDVSVDHVLSIRDMSSVSMARWHSITGSDSTFTIEMRRSRLTRFAAALEGVAYAGLLTATGYPAHARVRFSQAFRVLKSVL